MSEAKDLEFFKAMRSVGRQERNMAKTKKAETQSDSRTELLKKLEAMAGFFVEAQEAIDNAQKHLNDPDVKAALEAVADDWEIRDHADKAEAAASQMLSISEDLETARKGLLISVKPNGATLVPKAPKRDTIP
jgi:hypothetical protein